MKGMHWWCYIGYEDLFKAVFGRLPTKDERAVFKKMTRTQRNDWVLERVGKTKGTFFAMDQRAENGYVAFSTLPYLCKGLADGEIVVPEGKTDFVIPHPGTTKWGFSIERRGDCYDIVSWWNNDQVDRGQTTISMDESGDLLNHRMVSPKLQYPLKYNWDARHWEPET